MKFSQPFQCQCGEPIRVETSGTALPKDTQCPNCGASIWFIEPLGNVVGLRILDRAYSELQNGDYTLTIMLGAIAVECEMLRLFIKWRGLDQMRANHTAVMPSKAEEDAWGKEWRKLSRIGTRLEELAKLLIGQDFDSFLSQNANLLNPVYTTYPGLKSRTSSKECFRLELFNRRNKVLHHVEIDFGKSDGEMCFELASTLTSILKRMDDHRIALLETALAAER